MQCMPSFLTRSRKFVNFLALVRYPETFMGNNKTVEIETKYSYFVLVFWNPHKTGNFSAHTSICQISEFIIILSPNNACNS